jgi:hypothetical protein
MVSTEEAKAIILHNGVLQYEKQQLLKTSFQLEMFLCSLPYENISKLSLRERQERVYIMNKRILVLQ